MAPGIGGAPVPRRGLLNRTGESGEQWQSLRMPRHFNVMLQTQTGLTHGSLVWIDQLHVHVLCPERLPVSRGLRMRIDLGSLGDSVDLQITVSELAVGKSRQAGRGWLHQARWIALSLEQGDELTGMLPRINTQLALHSVLSSASRSRVSSASQVQDRQSMTRVREHGPPSQSTMPSAVDSASSSRGRSRTSSRRGSGATGSRSSRSSRRGRRVSVPAVLAPGNPVNLLVQVDDRKQLGRALRLQDGSLRLAVKLAREADAVTSLTLVFRLPDGSFMQHPALVLRVAGRRWLLEAQDVSKVDLALLRNLLPPDSSQR